jgi:ribose transport system substrate-binding protein
MKRLLAVAVIAAFAAAVAATAVGSAKSAPATRHAQLVFGYISPGPDTWYQRDVDGFKYAAAKYGVKVVVLNSQYDQQKELANIQSLVNQGVDGISMFSFDTNGAIRTAQQGLKAHIPVVLTDDVGHAFQSGAKLAAEIDFNWAKIGSSYADYMAKTWPGQNFAMLAGNYQAPPTQILDKALQARAKQLGKNKLVYIQQTMYNPATAVNLASDLVASGKKFGPLFVMNDDMGAAVARFLKGKGLLNNPIHLMTENGSPVGLQMLKNGELKYSVSSSPGWEGMVAFLALYQAAKGRISATGNAHYMLPVIPITPETSDNPMSVVPWVPGQVHWTLTQKYFPQLLKK